MKVILTADVDKLGRSGELKEVADGYARNFLLARKLAVPAAGGAYRAWQHDIASREEKRKREREDERILFWPVMGASVVGVILLSLLELFVAFLQAYIFTFLSALFIGSAVHPH